MAQNLQATQTLLTCVPAAATSVSITPSSTAWASSAYVQVVASTSTAATIVGAVINTGIGSVDFELDIAKGASGSEVVIGTLAGESQSTGVGGNCQVEFAIPITGVAAGTRLSVRLRKTGTSTVAWGAAVLYYAAASLESGILTTANAQKVVPSAAAGVSLTPSGTSWASSSWVQVSAGIAGSGQVLAGIAFYTGAAQPTEIDLGTGASGSQVVIATFRFNIDTSAGMPFVAPCEPPLDNWPASTILWARMRHNGTNTTACRLKAMYYSKPI